MSKKLQAETLQATASTKDKIKNALNAYTPLLRENFKSTFVTLQGGKDLSTNDFTNDFKTKLTSIESGAQVNKLEKILLNGTNISIGADKSANITLSGGSDNNFTDAYKTKLEGIQAGAQVNVIENIAVNGVNASINNKTANLSISSGLENFTVNGAAVTAMSVTGAASVTTANNTATINVAEAEKFTLNGATVKSASITGANVSIDSGNACITIQSAEAKNVTINGAESNIISISGAAQISYNSDTKVTSVVIADDVKADAQFTLSTDTITLPATSTATITASRLGNGLITATSNEVAKTERLSATSFKITGQEEGTANIGLFLCETADYYASAKNVAVNVTDGIPKLVYFNFNNKQNLWQNAGTLNLTRTQTGRIDNDNVEDGDYGSGIYAYYAFSFKAAGYNLFKKDFTLKFRSRYVPGYDPTNVMLKSGTDIIASINLSKQSNGSITTTFRIAGKILTHEIDDIAWHDFKITYSFDDLIAKYYLDDVLLQTYENVNTLAVNELNLFVGGTVNEVKLLDRVI